MKSRLLLLPLVASLGACSGGHDDGPVTPPTPETVPSLISGELTALNKETGAATIGAHQLNLSKAAPVTRSMDLSTLEVGMILTVQADKDGVVSTVKIDDLLTAPVTAIAAGKLEVAGFEIVYNKALPKLSLGDMVEVSGYPLDGSRIQATFVELEEDKLGTVDDSEIEGTVSQLNDAKTEFMLGNVLVKIGHVDQPSKLKNGAWVEVKGLLDADKGSESWTQLHINNADVEIDTPDYDDVDGEIEIAGRISWVAQDQTHMVVNQNLAVGISDRTELEDGGKALLKPGIMVEVEGNWDLGAMRLNATEIEFDGDNEVSIELPEFEAQGYADYNAETGVITMNDIPFYVSPRTQFEDGLNKDRNFTNEWIEFSGYQQGNDYLAQEVENDDIDPSRVELEGKVIDGTGPSATLLGYRATNNQLAQFIGKQVEAKCDLTPNSMLDNCDVSVDND